MKVELEWLQAGVLRLELNCAYLHTDSAGDTLLHLQAVTAPTKRKCLYSGEDSRLISNGAPAH